MDWNQANFCTPICREAGYLTETAKKFRLRESNWGELSLVKLRLLVRIPRQPQKRTTQLLHLRIGKLLGRTRLEII
jgi:hypothetical protein